MKVPFDYALVMQQLIHGIDQLCVSLWKFVEKRQQRFKLFTH